jgi:small subunit ribosomal protein S20
MPNIKQQARRVATSERQRQENLRWRSTVKTLLRRLEDAVEDGDSERIAEEHHAYVRWIDKAAARRAIHPNRAARKKSQAAQLVADATADE